MKKASITEGHRWITIYGTYQDMLAWGWLAVSSLLLTQNPNWPNEMSDTPASSLALKQNRPDDPDYFRSDECEGQSSLFSFTPTCAASLFAAQAEDGLGIHADRAWLFTTGDPKIKIAVFVETVDFSDIDLVARWALNAKELPVPITASTSASLGHDQNQDGVFNILDYSSASGTITPTLDRVIDQALLLRPDRGDANGNGILDPEDLIIIYADGIDDDQNQRIDDICGWDFVDKDANVQTTGEKRIQASPPFNKYTNHSTLHDNHRARAIAATANNGFAGVGVCPNCSIIPIRIGQTKKVRASDLLHALRYLADQNVQVASLKQLPERPFDVHPDELSQVMQWLDSKNILVIVDAPQESGFELDLPWRQEHAFLVGEISPDHSILAASKTVFHQSPCANNGPSIKVNAPGNCDGLSGALAAGTAGLILAAAEGMSRLGINALKDKLRTTEIKQILIDTADQPSGIDPQSNQSPPNFQTNRGYGRINARAAVEAVIQRNIPPMLRIVYPEEFTQLDPSDGQPFVVTARIENPRHEMAEWTLAYALGAQATTDDFVAVSRGIIMQGESIDVAGDIPVNGLINDPTAPPFDTFSAAMTLRVSISAKTESGVIQSEARRIIFLHHDLHLLPGFPIHLDFKPSLPAVFIDINQDAQDELLVVSPDSTIHAYNQEGQSLESWPLRLAFSNQAAGLSFAILSPEESMSIVIASAIGEVDVIGLNRVRRSGFPVALKDARDTSFAPVLFDLDGDLKKEIILASLDGQVMAWRENALPVDGFPIELGQSIGPLAVGHFGQDRTPGIIAAGQTQAFLLQTKKGQSYRVTQTWTLPASPQPVGPVVANIDQDDEDEFLIARVGGEALRFNPPALGYERFSTHQRLDFGAASSVSRDGPEVFCAAGQSSLADLNRDGIIEFIHSARSTDFDQTDYEGPLPRPEFLIAAWETQGGTTPSAFPIERGFRAQQPALVLDLDRDQRPEVIFADGHFKLQARSAAGVSPAGWPKAIDGKLVGTVAAGDFNGDQKLEILATSSKGSLFVWRTKALKDGPMAWPFARHDLQATANYGTPIAINKTSEQTNNCQCRHIDSPHAKTLNNACFAVFCFFMALLRITRRRHSSLSTRLREPTKSKSLSRR